MKTTEIEKQIRELCQTDNDALRLIHEMLSGIPELDKLGDLMRSPEIDCLNDDIEALKEEVRYLENVIDDKKDEIEALENELSEP